MPKPPKQTLKRKKEAPVKDRIKDVLTDAHVHFRMPPANGYGKSGDFDFVCCVSGSYLGIEAKRDDKELPTGLQNDNAKATLAAGGVVLLIHKDNLDLVAHTIAAMRTHGPDVFSYWPEAPEPVNDTDVVLRRKK